MRSSQQIKQVQMIAEKQETKEREMLKMGGLMAAAGAARVALQWVPFLEPVTSATLIAGTLWGKKRGAFFGAMLIFLSNFAVMGGNGPWTLFQCIGMAMVGQIGSKILVTSKRGAVAAAAIGTTIYDLITNMMWVAIAGPAVLISGLPIFALHLLTNTGMALTLPKMVEKLSKL